MKVNQKLRATQEVMGTIGNAGGMCTLAGAFRYLRESFKHFPLFVTMNENQIIVTHRRTQRIYATIQA